MPPISPDQSVSWREQTGRIRLPFGSYVVGVGGFSKGRRCNEPKRPRSLGRVLPPLATRTRAHFDGDSTFYNFFIGERDLEKYGRDVRNRWHFGLVDDVLRQHCARPGTDVLAVGSGFAVGRRFLSAPRTYIGTDTSGKTVDLARRLHPQAQAEFHVESLPTLLLQSASVDAALCPEVLEHLDHDRAAVREPRRVLRPRGLPIMSIPQRYNLTAYRHLIGHVRHYTARSLQDVHRREGFQFVDGLPQFLRTSRAYHYADVAGRGVESLARIAAGRDATLYDSRAYNCLASTLLQALDAHGTQASRGSTFVVGPRGEE